MCSSAAAQQTSFLHHTNLGFLHIRLDLYCLICCPLPPKLSVNIPLRTLFVVLRFLYEIIIRSIFQGYATVTPFHLHPWKMMQPFLPPIETSRSFLEFCRRVLNSVDLLMTWLVIVTINLPLECPTSNHDKIPPNNTKIMRNQHLLLLEDG